MALTAQITTSIVASLTGAPDVGAVSQEISDKLRLTLTSGTGANQANNIFTDDFSIVGAGTQTYDLAGALTNGIGGTAIFTAIKMIAIKNNGTTALTYGGGSASFLGFLGDATDEIVVPAGGFIVLADPTAAGQAVTATTADLITLSGTDVSGTIYIIGES